MRALLVVLAVLFLIILVTTDDAEAGERQLRVCNTTRQFHTEPFKRYDRVLVRAWANGKELTGFIGRPYWRWAGRGVLVSALATERYGPIRIRVANTNVGCSRVRITWALAS